MPTAPANNPPVYFIRLTRYSALQVPGTNRMQLFPTREAAMACLDQLPRGMQSGAEVQVERKAVALEDAWRFYGCDKETA